MSIMSEGDLQESVRQLALISGWLHYHTFRSTKSAKGFPDSILIRGTRLIAVELKSDIGRVTTEQQTWLNGFTGTGAETYTWRPEDWQSGRIEDVLR